MPSFLFTIPTFFAAAAGGEGGLGDYVIIFAKLFNLLLFLAVLLYLLRKPISESLRARRENIRRDLMRAQEERNAALAKLEEVDARLTLLGAEAEAVRTQARAEAEAERQRIELATEEEAARLREQARREIESAGKSARVELRRFAAEESIRRAEELIRRELRPEDEARLVNEYVEELGGRGR